MTRLHAALSRKSETAAHAQTRVRETGPRGYRDPATQPIILANRIYRRRHLRHRTV